MEEYNIEKLKSKKFIEDLRTEVELVSDSGIGAVNDRQYWLKGKEISNALKSNSSLRDSDPELYKEYLRLVDLIQMQTFYLEDIETILEFLEENLIACIINNVDVITNIRVALFTQIYAGVDRERFVKRIKEVIEQSREEFGADYVEIGSMKAQVRAYLKNWIQDYKNTTGGEKHFNMEITDYLFKSTNASKLSSEDKDVLRKVLVLYERTKRDPIDPDSLTLYDFEYYGLESYGGEGFKTRFKLLDEEYLTDAEIDKSVVEDADVAKVSKVTEVVKATDAIKATKDTDVAKVADETMVAKKPVDLRERIANMSKGKENVQKVSAPAQSGVTFSMENIESIKKLNAEVLRKISNDPKIAVNKIKSEIIRLTASNPQDMPKAKELWQLSGLYNLYIEMSKQGMEANMPIDKVIESRTTAGKDVLTEDEFKAVVELSKTF